jgi:hypothetical protein
MVVDDRAIVTVDVIDARYRPVRVETNAQEVAPISRVQIACDEERSLSLLFDRS